MSELFGSYLDDRLVDAVASLVPMVGYGVILGIIFAVIGWLFGFVIRSARADL